jgi:transcriptional regulator with PAS, ATPase and Fis domain
MAVVTQIKSTLAAALYRKVRVLVTSGPDAGQQIDVAGREIRIGTAVENELVLRDETISRFHCALEPTEFGLRVRDEGSTNGVWSAGNRIFDALLVATPVVLQLGDTQISVSPLNVTVERERLNIDRFGRMLGQSSRMRELFADLQRIAAVDISVLIEGETGTGKELVAEAIHDHSPRQDGPFVVFDCSAVAPNLAESELFGHVRGAFTGAVEPRVGVFEQAQGGTIFLDELGELPKELQPKLLRVLEKREVRRLGASRSVPIDVRVVAATNRNLAAEVQRGAFREDLYFRVACAHIAVPALRSRMDDLPLLVEHFLATLQLPGTPATIPSQVWELFRSHRWPGNVRELKNAVQRFLFMPERGFPHATTTGGPKWDTFISLRDARQEAIDAFEKEYLKAVLDASEGNVTRAAAKVDATSPALENRAAGSSSRQRVMARAMNAGTPYASGSGGRWR